MNFINYAHRGASSYAPGNTFAAFYLGCEMNANGIETDVQQTKDGVLVLIHDPRILFQGEKTAISDLTYAQLLSVDLGAEMPKYSGERIPTFEEFIRHFGSKPVHMAIELKATGIARETIDLIHRYGCSERIIITSFSRQALEEAQQADPSLRLGYLTYELNDEVLQYVLSKGYFQICPRACVFTDEWNRRLRDAGLSIRAWGVENEEIMLKMLEQKVDGMTIDFPDVLARTLLKQIHISEKR